MAVLLYTYAFTSIRAAKRNAQLHREADGGQLDMRKESLRRHGVLEPVKGTSGLDLFRNARAESKQDSKSSTDKKAKPMNLEQKEESRSLRTQDESILDGHRGAAVLQKLKDGRPE